MSKQNYKIGNIFDLISKIPDKSIDLVLTDPPYNANMDYELIDDNLPYEDYLEWSQRWFNECKRVSHSIILTPGFKNLKMWITEIEYPKGIAILYAPNQLSASNLGGWNHWEPILCYGKLSIGKNVFKHNNTRQPDIGNHPCPKQLSAFKDILNSVRPQPKCVLDPFLGSGTTLRACRELDINGLGFEINPNYSVIIDDRMKKATCKLDTWI